MASPYVVRRDRKLPSVRAAHPGLHSLDVELTENCGFDCLHCAVRSDSGGRSGGRAELSPAEVRRILEEAVALGCRSVRFTGGDPLIRPDFPEIYLTARRLGLRVTLCTNAETVTADLAVLLNRVPPLEPVELTVYGMSETSYETVTRRPGAFARARRGIALLAEHGIRMSLKGVVFPFNVDELESLEAWTRAFPGNESGLGLILLLELRHRRDSELRNETIRGLRLPPEDIPAFMARGRKAYRRETKDFLLRFAGSKGERLFSCGAGREFNCVDAYGRLQPCLPLRSPALTVDLRESPLAEARAGISAALGSLRAEDPEFLRRCARCPLRGLCEQCPAKSWMEHGRLDAPVDYFCRVAHAQARGLGLLAEGEKAWEAADWDARVEAMTEEEEA